MARLPSTSSKHLSEMRVQVIEHQVNSARFGVYASEQFFDEGDEVSLSSTRCDRDDSLPTLGLDRYEQIGGAVAYVLIVILDWAVGCHGQW